MSTDAYQLGPSPTPKEGEASLCVLASSSGGNCSVLLYHDRGRRRAALLDAGLSPRRTAALLSELGVGLREVSDVIFTHLDTDHAHAGWKRPPRDFTGTIRIHRKQMGRAERSGLLTNRTDPFNDEPFELAPGVTVDHVDLAHDDLGVSAFRFGFQGKSSLGFATDLGRLTDALVETLSGVDVLAIESNYCPKMQAESTRPAYLKRRIMDGSGHLSNQEALTAVEDIAPREHAVFLHLSRECNTPETVAAMHAGSDYAFTIAEPDRPSRWVAIREGRAPKIKARAGAWLFSEESADA